MFRLLFPLSLVNANHQYFDVDVKKLYKVMDLLFSKSRRANK